MNSTSGQNPTLLKTLREDVSGGDFFSNLKEEWREILEFYISEEERDRLRSMSPFKRWFVVGWWVLKSMFFKLTPFRRLLLVAGLVLVLSLTVRIQVGGGSITTDPRLFVVVGVAAILLVLLLELKDKLLVRSELHDGRAIQRAMQPEPSPVVRGWRLWFYTRPANEVCGDILDFFPAGAGRFIVVAGDVAGKGLGAALQMVKIQASLRAMHAQGEEFPSLVGRLNRLMLNEKLPERFASLLLMEIAEDAGLCRYVNAGHMPPVLVSEATLQVLPRGNAAVGLSPDVSYEERTLNLEAGMCLVLYSDGVTEAENRQGECFGMERLTAACRASGAGSAVEIGEAIVRAVDAFVDSHRAKDDLSLIILQRSAS